MNFEDPTTAALLVAEIFERAGIEHALYGGLLLAAYGEPRETRDADVAVVRADVDDAERVLRAGDIATQLSFREITFGGLTLSRITLLGGPGATGLNTLDLVTPRSLRYAEQAIARALRAPLRGVEIRVLTPEDFVLFKLLSTRERDLDDAVTVLRRSGAALELDLVEREVELLDRELPEAGAMARYAELRRRLANR